MKNFSEDITQIGVGAVAGAVAMTAGQYLVAIPIGKKVSAWRKKIGELQDANKMDEAAALEKNAPIGTKMSATTIKDLSVLGAGILAKTLAPKNSYTEYATDGIIFFAIASLITRKISVVSYTAQFPEDK